MPETPGMSGPQKALGWSLLGVVSASALNMWLFQAMVDGPWPEGGPSLAERVVLEFPDYLPYVLAPFLVLQPFVLLAWAVRSPRVSDESGLKVAATRLAQWLKWGLVILSISAVAVGAAIVSRQRVTVLLMLLTPLFGWAYTAGMYRALQIQAYRVREGLSGVKTSHLALGAMMPTMLIPFWPLGLLIPAWVSHQARVEPTL